MSQMVSHAKRPFCASGPQAETRCTPTDTEPPPPAQYNTAHHNHCNTNTPQRTAPHSTTSVAEKHMALAKFESFDRKWCIVIESRRVQGWIETGS
jgi:hypothetical protein